MKTVKQNLFNSWCENAKTWIVIISAIVSLCTWVISSFVRQHDINQTTISNSSDISEIKKDVEIIKNDMAVIKTKLDFMSKSVAHNNSFNTKAFALIHEDK